MQLSASPGTSIRALPQNMMLQPWARLESAQTPAQSPQRATASAGRGSTEPEHLEMRACQEAVAVRFGLGRVDVDRRARHPAAPDGFCQRGQVHHLPPAGVDQVTARRRRHTPQPLSQRQLTGGPALPDIPLITQAQYTPPPPPSWCGQLYLSKLPSGRPLRSTLRAYWGNITLHHKPAWGPWARGCEGFKMSDGGAAPALAHVHELPAADHVGRLLGGRHMQRHKVRAAQQLLQ